MTTVRDVVERDALRGRLEIYYDTLLNSVADGVLAISPDRRVEILNATGAAILGRDPKSVVGSTLLEAFLHDEANDGFVDAVLAAIGEENRTINRLVDFDRHGELRRLAVASTGYRAPTGLHAGRLAVVVTFNDVTEMLRLRASEEALEQELAGQHAKLRAAYASLEEAAERERRVSRRLSLIRTGAAVAVFCVFAGLGIYGWRTTAPANTMAQGSAPPGGGTFTVAARPVTSRVAIVGTVDAGSVVSVVGPFDGVVQKKYFEYGGPVERGQKLVTIDVTDTQVHLREAEGAEIKARQRMDELSGWDTGLEVTRARRGVATAELETNNLTGRLAQTKALLDKGIVAKDEYTQLLQQQHTQTLQLQTAREDLDATIAKGSEENRRVAEFELQNAQAKQEELQNDLAHAHVLASVSGVVLQPPDTDGKHAETVNVGSRVTRGQTMFTIGDLESFSIHAKVDEVDINKIRVGQPAIVTGDAFGDDSLDGAVTSVAAQASSQTTTGMATFPITVKIDHLTAQQRSRVHVGMSANLTIVTYDNPQALVVPQEALGNDGDRRTVRVRRGAETETIPVTLGISTPDGIEIREGLKGGDIVQLGD